MSILVHAEIEGDRLGEEEILQESLLILIGGDETTRHVMTGGLLELIRHPEQKRTLARDPSRIPVAVEEMLRWVSPIQNMNRTVARDTTLRGRTLRAGERLLLLYPSGNRDAEAFPDPDRFDPARADARTHLTFAQGPHACVGLHLARLEAGAALEAALDGWPGLRLEPGATPPTGVVFRKPQRVPVTWDQGEIDEAGYLRLRSTLQRG